MMPIHEERVFYAEQFVRKTFDLRSRILFWRFDACVFVNCKILLDNFTQQLAFTGCTFEDCNIDHLIADEERALIAYDNIFERPIAERKADFERRLAEALARACLSKLMKCSKNKPPRSLPGAQGSPSSFPQPRTM